MSLWLGPGLKFMQRSWGLNRQDGDEDSVLFALKFTGCLAELEWGGWKLVALPLLLKSTIKSDFFEKEPRRLIGFLAALKTAKKLITGETDAVWRARIEKCALDRLRAWKKQDDDSVCFCRFTCHLFSSIFTQEAELNDILTLSTFFSSAISSILVNIINRTLAATEEGQPSNASSAWLLGMCMQALAKRNPSEWITTVDLIAWMRTSIKKWAWSHEVLGALVRLSQARYISSLPCPSTADVCLI
jgi:U3 small nucleolar RNA-associated protein 20